MMTGPREHGLPSRQLKYEDAALTLADGNPLAVRSDIQRRGAEPSVLPPDDLLARDRVPYAD